MLAQPGSARPNRWLRWRRRRPEAIDNHHHGSAGISAIVKGSGRVRGRKPPAGRPELGPHYAHIVAPRYLINSAA